MALWQEGADDQVEPSKSYQIVKVIELIIAKYIIQRAKNAVDKNNRYQYV